MRGSRQSEQEELSETSVALQSRTTKLMNNAERNYTLCLQFSQTKHFYIALALHTFKKIISDRIWDIHDCYALHAKSLDQEFGPFCKNVLLQLLYESDEDLEEQMHIRRNQDGHHSNRVAGFTNLIFSDENGEDNLKEYNWISYFVNKVMLQYRDLFQYQFRQIFFLNTHVTEFYKLKRSTAKISSMIDQIEPSGNTFNYWY